MNTEAEEFMIDSYAIVASLLEQATTREFADLDAAIHFAVNPHSDDIVVLRYLVRRAILACAVEGLIDAGYTVRLRDGGKWTTSETTDVDEITAAWMANGQETLYVRDPDHWEGTSTISLINDELGWEAFDRYASELTPYLSRAFALADSLRASLDRYVDSRS
ncbi:hypothetical protein GIY62_35455 (plasmid) [Burkholderia plantarii]|nr:hypothetical protein GIY62_35455 [Burkholderia plantarii]